MAKRKPKIKKQIDALTHREDKRKNIPTAEYQSVLRDEEKNPIRVAYERRNRDLDPQLVWRGKDEQDWSDLVVQAPPLYIQEKVHPKILIDDLRSQTENREGEGQPRQLDLFGDFNGIPDEAAKTEFYQHDANWTNRMILGDSLQVMASLAEREGLRGKVQCIYLDPPYGIKFNSNFQWSTTSRDVKDGNKKHITREPEQVKAFRDTWRDGIHSYLTYLRDRLTVARDLLTDSGSIFVQIGDENLAKVRSILDEIFGEDNFVISIPFQKKAYQEALSLAPVNDYILWVAKSKQLLKYRPLYIPTPFEGHVGKYTRIESQDLIIDKSNNKNTGEISSLLDKGWRLFREDYPVVSQDPPKKPQPFDYCGVTYNPPPGRHWSQKWPEGMQRLAIANRLRGTGTRLYAREYWTDSAIVPRNNLWVQLKGPAHPNYVVETATEVVKRCILMSTDPGDLILDPTCGSGTTAYVAEQWGRRWITIDTSRVALALARARIMGARYPYYLLADSPEGQKKEAEITRTIPSESPTFGNIRQGFVYQRVPHITLKAIANNAEIDVIWDNFQETLEPLRKQLNKELDQDWQEWEIPREAEEEWSSKAKQLHKKFWHLRIKRQQEIDASIAAKADFEYLYDKPYEDRKKVRVAGPFTVESLSPHRVLGVDENDELIDPLKSDQQDTDQQGFVRMILDNLKTAGVQQAHKEDKINFSSITPWPGDYICAEGRYLEGEEESGPEKRAAIFIGPEFGTVSRPDLVAAAREAGDAGFDALIACAFNYDAHSSEFNKLGRIPVLKARMNADLHMADDLKNTGKGNLFVIFGEPDIDIQEIEDNKIQVRINGVDVFHPNTGEVRSDSADGIACWFIDTDYNEESFFVRHAYFLGANDPYKALKTTLKAEIDKEAWDTLHSDISRPFDRPESSRIAVKVINHLGDEVMKVYSV
ncbi:DNA methylase [Desulfomarina profundi]|uniref:DNA methylase n=1 Tax=Desulfomarina profundi TaxID=2772557 RepID=A0A8D5FK73_9BACT|nr:site-specific DNA-methyltransferase [Desulfomarina profundi]BCL62893.1 DNA methylase [Desulfomarina profundi]